jgi:hypothetical protein
VSVSAGASLQVPALWDTWPSNVTWVDVHRGAFA